MGATRRKFGGEFELEAVRSVVALAGVWRRLSGWMTTAKAAARRSVGKPTWGRRSLQRQSVGRAAGLPVVTFGGGSRCR